MIIYSISCHLRHRHDIVWEMSQAGPFDKTGLICLIAGGEALPTRRRWRLHTALTAAAIEKKGSGQRTSLYMAAVHGYRCSDAEQAGSHRAAHQRRANCQRLWRLAIGTCDHNAAPGRPLTPRTRLPTSARSVPCWQ